MQLQSRITNQSQDFGGATPGMIALRALGVELAKDACVPAVFHKMRADWEHRRQIARFQRLVKAGWT